MHGLEVRVVVPFRPSPTRMPVWRVVLRQWESWNVHVGLIDPDLNVHAAKNRAAEGAWDVAVFADADLLLDMTAVEKACALADRTDRIVAPFDMLHYLSWRGTVRLVEGEPLDIESMVDPLEPSVKNTWLGALVVPRGVWDEVGGFDERFVGMGKGDVAFFHACMTLGGGAERVRGDLCHLWHEADRDRRSARYRRNERLAERYQRASGRPEEMRELLAQR